MPSLLALMLATPTPEPTAPSPALGKWNVEYRESGSAL